MFRIIKMGTCLGLSTLLVACAASKYSSNDKDTEDRKIQTAKINAQLGIAYLEQHNIPRAKQKLILALDEGPSIPETWYSMAYFFEATGNNAEADKYYLKAIATAPHRGDSQNNYGTFLCRSGRYQEAIQHFMLAVKDKDYLNPGDAYENAGLCALKTPDHQQASLYFQKALMQDPARPVSLMNLAELDYRDGNYKAAHEKLNQFLAVSPATPKSSLLSMNLQKKLNTQMA